MQQICLRICQCQTLIILPLIIFIIIITIIIIIIIVIIIIIIINVRHLISFFQKFLTTASSSTSSEHLVFTFDQIKTSYFIKIHNTRKLQSTDKCIRRTMTNTVVNNDKYNCNGWRDLHLFIARTIYLFSPSRCQSNICY